MAHALLHHLNRQFEAAIRLPVDAVGGIEMPEGMRPGVFGLAVAVDDASGDLHRLDNPPDEAVKPLWPAFAGRKYQP